MKNGVTKRQNPFTKIVLDLALAIFFIVALSFRATSAEVHEWAGLVACTLVALHCWWNRRWFTTILKGKNSLRRMLNTAIILLLVLSVSIICITGLMNSSHVLGFLKLDGNLQARQIHVIVSYWALVLVGIHVGMHWKTITTILSSKTGWSASSVAARIGLRFCALLTALSGIWASFDRSMGEKLFYGATFDFWPPERSSLLLLVANLGILGVYAITTHILFSVARKRPPLLSSKDSS